MVEASTTPDPVLREDLVAALLGALVIGGLFLDGWNHINLQDGALGGFFTRWHAVLYAGFAASASWVVMHNRHLVMTSVKPRARYHRYFGRPLRYPFALFGIGIATVGMIGDLVWHTLFGDEVGVARVIAPFHLVLFSGAVLLLAAPLRSAWFASDAYPSDAPFGRLFPALLSLTMVTAGVAFMFQWLSAFIDWEPTLRIGDLPPALAAEPAVLNTVELASVARVLVTNLILIAPWLVAVRRWRLPAGSTVFLFTGVALLMATLTEFRLGWSVVAGVVGGAVGDVLIWRLRPSAERVHVHRVLSAAVPVALWGSYFAAIAVGHDVRWPSDLWIGTIGLCVITSVLLSLLVLPPEPPESWA